MHSAYPSEINQIIRIVIVLYLNPKQKQHFDLNQQNYYNHKKKKKIRNI